MKVFISSVIADFEEFRTAAARAAETLGHQVLRAEDFSAQSDSPRIACLSAVRDADLIILLMGARYGEIQQKSGLSATHEEYREARERCPVLVMVQSAAEREGKQAGFLQEVRDWGSGHLTGSFSDPESLRDAVEHGIYTKDFIKELKENAEKVKPSSPYLDNILGFQGLSEISMVEDWAKEMRKQGHSICKISKNKNDPPDVLATLDGKPIGIEVTNLVIYLRNGQHAHEWTLEDFKERLMEIVETKDQKACRKRKERSERDGKRALDCRLHKLILLIFTPEMYLQRRIKEFLDQITLPQPHVFGQVFVMGDEVPSPDSNSGIRGEWNPETSSYDDPEVGPDNSGEHHPVFEVRLSIE